MAFRRRSVTKRGARRPMTKRGSRKSFRRHSGTHKMNRPRRLTRGGFRI